MSHLLTFGEITGVWTGFQECHVMESNGRRKLDVHHVHYDKENCEPDLVCLCMRCNLKVNNNRDYYEGFFIELLKSRGLIYDPAAQKLAEELGIKLRRLK